MQSSTCQREGVCQSHMPEYAEGDRCVWETRMWVSGGHTVAVRGGATPLDTCPLLSQSQQLRPTTLAKACSSRLRSSVSAGEGGRSKAHGLQKSPSEHLQ